MVDLILPCNLQEKEDCEKIRKKCNMAFGSTLTLTVNAVAKVLNKVKEQDYGSEYKLIEATGEFLVTIKHSEETPKSATALRYDRHYVDFKQTVYGIGGLPDTVREMYCVIRNAKGDGLVLPNYLSAAAVDFLDSGTVQADLFSWLS
jgi:hypothetical protein